MDSNNSTKNWLADLKGKNNNSYKYVLQLAILDSIKKSIYQIKITDLLTVFIKTYWDNCVVYNLRESSNTDQTPSIIKVILDFAEKRTLLGISYKDLKRKKSISENILLVEIESGLPKRFKVLMQNPISRLQRDANILNRRSGGDETGNGWLYDWDINKNIININPRQAKIINNNIDLYTKLTYHYWVLYIEPYNMTPSLLSKLSRKVISRSIPEKTKKLISTFRPHSCFYCNKSEIKLEIDHFIPFSYVNHHEAYNLVYSCSECNRGANGKFEKLPSVSFLNKFIKLNRTFEEHYFKENIESKIKGTYEDCSKSGYVQWK